MGPRPLGSVGRAGAETPAVWGGEGAFPIVCVLRIALKPPPPAPANLSPAHLTHFLKPSSQIQL